MPKKLFVKGKSGNPRGPLAGSFKAQRINSRFNMQEFCDAVRLVEDSKKKRFFVHFVERAYENDKVLCVLINKFVPDVRPREDQTEENEMLRQKLGFIGVPTNKEAKLPFDNYLEENK